MHRYLQLKMGLPPVLKAGSSGIYLNRLQNRSQNAIDCKIIYINRLSLRIDFNIDCKIDYFNRFLNRLSLKIDLQQKLIMEIDFKNRENRLK